MRIIYVYQYFGTPIGSWSTRVYEFTRRWVENGHHVTVITSPYDKSDITASKLISYQEVEGINLIVVNAGDSNRYPKFKRIIRALTFSIISSFFVIYRKADVVIASSGPITVGLPGILAKWFGSKKLVFEVRDLWPMGAIELGLVSKNIGKLGIRLEKFIYRQSDLIITCSEGMQDNLNSRFNNLNILTVPNVANENLIYTANVNFQYPSWLDLTRHHVLLYAGSLGLMDAVDEVIEGFIFKEIDKNIKLVVIGEGTERSKLEQIVENNALSNQIHFMGLLPKRDVVQWYKIARYSFVLFKNFPVLGTSSPNKLFDSIAYSVPIIQNTNGWISKLISDYDIGYNVECNNPKHMFDVILKTQELNKHLQQRSNMLKVKEAYKMERISQKYIMALEKLHERVII